MIIKQHMYIKCWTLLAGSGPLGQLDAPSDLYSGGRWFDPQVWPYSFRRDLVMK